MDSIYNYYNKDKSKNNVTIFLICLIFLIGIVLPFFLHYYFSSKSILHNDNITLVVGDKLALPLNDKFVYDFMSSDENVVIVNNSGELEAIGEGKAIIKVSYNGKSNEYEIVVINEENAIQVEKITLSDSDVSLKIGENHKLTYAVEPLNGTNKSVTWYSSNEKVITVKDGNVIAIGSGIANVTVATGNGKIATCKLTVVGNDDNAANNSVVEVESIKFSVDKVTLNNGEYFHLNYNIFPNEASTEIIWNSSNNKVVSISGDGLLQAKSAGTVVVTANTLNGKSDTLKITVVNPLILPTSIEIGKKDTNLVVGSKMQLSANILPIDVTNNKVEWSSSNTSVATIDDSGLIEAKAIGSCIVTASTVNKLKASIKITVVKKEIEVSSLSFDKDNANIEIGSTLQLREVYMPSNATNTSVVWISSDENIATVNSSGLVTGKKTGTVTITAKWKAVSPWISGNATSASCKINVK